MTIPVLMASWFVERRAPRQSAGETSLMYTPTIASAIPTPTPVRKRPTRSTGNAQPRAMRDQPRMKGTQAQVRARVLPRWSETKEAPAPPKIAPTVLIACA